MKEIRLIISCLLFTPVAGFACGPWIPTPYIVRNDRDFYAAPSMNFMRELEQSLPTDIPHQAVIVEDQAPDATEGLRATLLADGVPKAAMEQVLSDYERYRQLLNDAKRYRDIPPYRCYQAPSDERTEEELLATLREQRPPETLPKEFQLYLNGARQYYLNNLSVAEAEWNRLLDLSPEQRPCQSVRAAYMLARVGTDFQAPRRYQRVRDLVRIGFDDPDGLAAASYGSEAQVALRQKNYVRAVELYLDQWQAGYTNAALSLRRTAEQIWQHADDSQFAKLAQHAQVRAVLTADLLTSYDSAETQQRRHRLLHALPSLDKITLDEAGRFALLEYQQNNLSAARLWLEFASPRDALALWVRSKLMLRDGHIEEGKTVLIELLRNTDDDQPDWPRIDTHRAWGELGLLMLQKEAYDEAANCFVNAESWLDLAYVLERVMTLDELREWAIFAPKSIRSPGYLEPQVTNELIARRLMREAQFEEALAYFPTDLRIQAEAYIAAMRQASNPDAPTYQRAQQYWAAASIVRHFGLQLFATELDPDFAWSGGNYDWPAVVEQRKQQTPAFALNAPPRLEEKRIEASDVRINQRLHYRYRAAQLAELAAGLLPNNDENAARIYCIAGGWLKHRDPNSADRFYKQLVVRCPKTQLGQIAARLHWFPPDTAIPADPFEG